MRFRSILLLALPGLAAACQPALEPGPQVDLVASARLSTANRLLTTPGDTVATGMLARADGDSPLKQVRITVEYSPIPEPLDPLFYNTYPDLTKAPKTTLVYLDSTVSALSELYFQSVHGIRTTAGVETWSYMATDTEGRTGKSSQRLRLGRTDSAAVFHNYTATLEAPGALGRRRFLALREGFVLPSFSLRNQPANQQLIDLVFRPERGTAAPTLSTPADDSLGLASKWPQRLATLIRRTALTKSDFQAAGTAANFTAAYNGGTNFARPANTGPLAKDQVVAFLTPEGKYGLLYVEEIITTGTRSIRVQVRVGK
ncbi:hypothetical protein CDA63_02495 [Hymenobacter amundsenii]|uniref:DUF4270 family protein n=1 Tax=Hymenobacter amundsenii TaxID=2006685 RepID=A0A246FPI8_9BACT|nr:hypothetical protein [Hymenobacter amundsenii]OWP64647.1 hypothetical protein CDA63_02495 [Hymenobacter amundsenii]